MTKITKCIIPLLNIDKQLFTNKTFVDADIVDLYDKFVELKFRVNVKSLYFIKNILKCNNTFFKMGFKDGLLCVYFMIPKKYHFIVIMGLKDENSVSKSILDNALTYWTF